MRWTQTPPWKREGMLALAALVIAGALAVLGIATPGARLPAITLGNLLGGYALLAVLAAAAAPASVASRGARNLARLALALAFVQAALGGMIGAQFASLACPALTDCGAWSWTAFAEGGSWNPLRAPDLIDGHLTARDGAAGLHVLHRLNALVTAALIAAAAGSLRRSQPRLAFALAALVAIAARPGRERRCREAGARRGRRAQRQRSAAGRAAGAGRQSRDGRWRPPIARRCRRAPR